jgi:hypothetical protein
VILDLDISALAKLLIAEPGSQQVSAAVGSSLAAATDRLAYLEMVATLAKAVGTGRIGPPPWRQESMCESVASAMPLLLGQNLAAGMEKQQIPNLDNTVIKAASPSEEGRSFLTILCCSETLATLNWGYL